MNRNTVIKFLRNCALWAVLVIVVGVVYNRMQGTATKDDIGVPYTDLLLQIKEGKISKIFAENGVLHVTTKGGDKFDTYGITDPHFVDDALANGVLLYTKKPPEPQSFLMQIFVSWFPMLLLIAIWVIFMRRQAAGGSSGPMGGFGKSKARMLEEDKKQTFFADVAGCNEAKEEVKELVDFLKDPAKFQKLGGTIPRGILMIGPPGTGKTLLARAIAGEAGVKFFIISGSDFVEMYVGVGASRVRDMFEQAKQHAPCIIFIDEIDAVGRQRGGSGPGAGGNDEREQTLNQLLVEMDGFTGNEGVIVIAATNRADVLDKALLRPGRFDRQVMVGLPDIKGREEILGVHIKKVPAAADVELKYIARGTPGFSGADLANLINEAALFAARMNKREVSMSDLEKAKDKVLMGGENRAMIMPDKEKRNTAYHEAGHCIVGEKVPEHDPTYKVSIMPRGRALGVTMFLPEYDQYSASLEKLESQICALYGGRIAEELISGTKGVTTGASNDIERATELARNIVTKWGLSEKLGPLNYAEKEGMFQNKSVSPATEKIIEEEIRSIIDRCYQRATDILKENISILHAMAEALLKYETIDKDQIDDLMKGKPVRDPKGWEDKPIVSIEKVDAAVPEVGEEKSAPVKSA